ncbi:MAG: amidohydrolase family protein [Candidatus Hydrogenedentota bacterium]
MSYVFARAKFLYPLSKKLGLSKCIEDGYVLSQGRSIIEVGKYTENIGKTILKKYSHNLKIIGINYKSSYSINDLVKHNGVLMPGFVKAHGHDHESPIIGLAKNEPLTEWLDHAVNVFTGFMNEKREELFKIFGKSPEFITYLKARVDDIYYGITSSLVHHCNYSKYRLKEIVDANKIAGTTMIVAVGSQDRNYDKRVLDKPEQAVKRLDEYLEKFGAEKRFSIVPGPDQDFSNGPKILKLLKKWADKHKTFIHCHSCEEPNTTKWFTETYKMTPVEYFDSIGFLDENTILAHQVNSTDNDLEILLKTKTKIVHNPLANTILGSGMPPIIKMMAMGIPVAISTDGSGSADNQNILIAAKMASAYQKAYLKDARVLPAQQLMEMITVVPAEFLRLNSGSLEKEKDADFIIIDLTKPNLTPSRIDNFVSNLIFASNGDEIKDVVANGIVLKENYQFKTIDVEAVLREVQLLSELMINYKKTVKEIRGTGAHR